ncbi:lytic transglycosylase domain-containing protein [Alphaproteobacteria bacterium]|nr:lytic transglycosylase domain-containing protein [Alphaproteobacteria bacterium]
MKFIIILLNLICMTLLSNNGFSKVLLSNDFTQNDIKNLIIKNSKLTNYVSPSLGLAVAKMESNFNHKAVSPKGAIGVMQIMPLTAKKIYGIKRYQLFNPVVNVKVGLHFLDHLIKKYRGRVDIALSHYNGGSSVGVWPNLKIIPATRSYVMKVLNHSSKLKNYNQKFLSKVKSKKDFFDPYAELNKNFASIDNWLKILDDYRNFYH